VQHIYTEIEIDAPPATVWEHLADVASYPAWNPHVIEVRGDLSVGSKLDITGRREGVTDRSMAVTVTDLERERRLAWVGTVLTGALFEGRHTFELEELDGGRTRLVNREDVRGLLAGVVVTDDPEVDYERMNAALKDRVERATVEPSP
jgi:hypothetical protein